MPVVTEHIRVFDLPELARKAEHDRDRFPVIPISRLRADAQAANPHATKDHVGLILAKKGDSCLGFMGIMPVPFASPANRSTIYILTTLFMEPSLRGTGAAAKMVESALSLGLDLYSVGNSKAAERFFPKVNGVRCPTYESITIPINPGASIGRLTSLAKKSMRRIGRPGWQSAFGAAGELALEGVTPIRKLGARRFKSKFTNGKPPLNFRAVTQLTEGVSRPTNKDSTRQEWTASTINWMLRYPWYVNDKWGMFGDSYHFAHSQDGFTYLAFEEASGKNEDKGFAVFLFRVRRGQRTLTLMPYRIGSGQNRELLAFAFQIAGQVGADILQVGGEFQADIDEAKIDFHKEPRVSFYWPAENSIFSKNTHPFEEEFTDGDIAFY